MCQIMIVPFDHAFKFTIIFGSICKAAFLWHELLDNIMFIRLYALYFIDSMIIIMFLSSEKLK